MGHSLRTEPVRIEELAAGENGFFTIRSQALTKESFDILKTKELAIEIFYEFAYVDMLEKQYVTAFCMALYVNGAAARRPIADCRKQIQQ